MAIHQKSEKLYLIDLDQNMEGFHQFISAWVYKTKSRILLVDPGPASTIPVLKNALYQLGVSKIDYILLTHIHIDHAGGTGLLSDDFPEVKIVCHPIGIPHMVNPDKLWQGSLQVLGEVARVYGRIAAIPSEKLIFPENISDENLNISVFETPGHASHHVSYLLDGILFAGEVAGVFLENINSFYLRIATPPKFIYEIYRNSLYKIADVPCSKICFGHYGTMGNPALLFSAAKEQLERWIKTCRIFFQHNPNPAAENIFEELLVTDPSLKAYRLLDKEVQKREKYFSINSINGMLEYIKKNG